MFDQSRKAFSDIIRMLEKMLDAFSVILFVVFTGFYGFQIYTHWNNGLTILIIYGALILIHTLSFIFSKTIKVDKSGTHAEQYVQKKSIRAKKRVFKIIKLSVNACAIGWNVFEIITKQVSDLRIMVVIITAVLLFAQILMEIIISLLIIYFDNLRIAVIQDVQGIDTESNFVTKILTKSLGIKKGLAKIQDENYLSEEEKIIGERQRSKH